MRSGKIPDDSITASSQTDQHPAHHGRLGRDSYWCSNDEATSYIEIRLSKRYKITEARVQIQNGHKVKNIALQLQNLQKEWINYHYGKVTTCFSSHDKFNLNVNTLSSQNPKKDM